MLFIGGGVLPLLWMGYLGVRHRGSRQDALDEEDLLLFTEVTPSAGPPDRELAVQLTVLAIISVLGRRIVRDIRRPPEVVGL